MRRVWFRLDHWPITDLCIHHNNRKLRIKVILKIRTLYRHYYFSILLFVHVLFPLTDLYSSDSDRYSRRRSLEEFNNRYTTNNYICTGTHPSTHWLYLGLYTMGVYMYIQIQYMNVRIHVIAVMFNLCTKACLPIIT